MALVYKMLEEGNGIEVDENGNPIVYDDADDKPIEDGNPFGLRATELYYKVPALQKEAKKYREGFKDLEPEDVHAKLKAYEEVNAKLKQFGDVEPEKAKEALTIVSNLGQLDKEKNIEIDKIKTNVEEAWKIKMRDMEKSFNTKVASLEDNIKSKDTSIRNLLVKGAFDGSTFIREETVLPPDIAYAKFGSHFQIEEDTNGELKAVAYDNNGDRILGLKSNPSDPAPPEEAIEKLISQYSQKDSILRTSGAGGSGAGGNSEAPGKKAKRAERAGMNPTARLGAIWSNK